MITYTARGPANSRYSGVHLRIVAYHPCAMPGTDLKVVIQVVEGGHPIAEDPITEAYLDPLELLAYLSESIREGWDVCQEAA